MAIRGAHVRVSCLALVLDGFQCSNSKMEYMDTLDTWFFETSIMEYNRMCKLVEWTLRNIDCLTVVNVFIISIGDTVLVEGPLST